MSIYLDYNATAPVDPSVLRQIPEWLSIYGNPSSVHGDGRRAKVALEGARAQVAEALRVEPTDVLFTSGGTEANNWAIFQTLRFHRSDKPAHLIVSAIEHSCIINAALYLESLGVLVSRIAPDRNGYVSVKDIESAIRTETCLISVMAANNEVGTVQPIVEIAELAESLGILFHSDCVQALGKIPIDFTKKGLAMASVSGHKLGALKGIGALIARDASELRPWTYGGGHEMGKRSGTENLMGILSFGDVLSGLDERLATNTQSKLDYFREKLLQAWPDLWMSGNAGKSLPNTVCLAKRGINGRSLMMNLDLAGISVSTGSACATGSIEPSHVLLAMGVDPWIVDGAIRISLGNETATENLDVAISAICDCFCRLA